MLAPALAIALTGEAAIAARRLAHFSKRQHQVDERQHRVGTLGLLFGTTTREHHARWRRRKHAHDAQLPFDGAASQSLDLRRSQRAHRAANVVESHGPRGNVFSVDEALFDGQGQQAIGQRQICARRRLHMHVGHAGGFCAAGIDDYKLAGRSLAVDPLHDGRHGVCAIGAPKDQGPGMGDVLHGEWQTAIDAKGLVLTGRRRGHAKAAVVVDERGFQGHPHEFAKEIGLLVGQCPTAESREGV